MAPPGALLLISPISQNITWDRNGPLPDLQTFSVTSGSNLVIYSITFENTSVNWIALGGMVDTDNNVVLFPPDSNTATINPLLQDVDLLSGSYYVAKIIFDNNGFVKTHTINLTITGEYNPIKTEKTNYNLVYNRISNTLSGDSVVNILNNTVPDQVTLETLGSLLLEKTFTSQFTLEEDPAAPFAGNAELPVTGTKVVSCRLKNDAGTVLYSFTVTIQVVNTNNITTDPAALAFTVYSHLSETKTSTLQLINPAAVAYTITAPDFITLNQSSGSSSTDIQVTTKDSSQLEAKEYTGDIVIAYSGKAVKVPVTVKNVNFIDLAVGDYNFCLDDFILTVQRINDAGKFVKISLDITIKTAFGTVHVTPVYQIAYFNGQASTDIGQKIHDHFPVFAGHLFSPSGTEFDNRFIYNPAKVTVTIDELDTNYGSVFNKKIENIRLFPGKKPKMFPVFSNARSKRIYSNTAHLFSYLTTMVQPSDITGKAVTANPYQPDEVNSAYFTDEDALMDFGVYKKVLGIEHLQFPKGDLQIYAQFINQNLVPELFVFNGFYTINAEFTHTYDDVDAAKRKYDTRAVTKMVLNTGYLLKEESNLVEELIHSMLAHIKIGSLIYKVLPVTGKITSENSETHMVSFELEFLIVDKNGN